MNILRAILKKEFLVVSRDIHSIAVLFIMPALFILVMSLAMRDLFQIHARAKISVLAVNLDEGKRARTFFEMLDAAGAFAIVRLEKEIPRDRIADLMYEKDYKFAVVARPNFTARIENRDRGALHRAAGKSHGERSDAGRHEGRRGQLPREAPPPGAAGGQRRAPRLCGHR